MYSACRNPTGGKASERDGDGDGDGIRHELILRADQKEYVQHQEEEQNG